MATRQASKPQPIAPVTHTFNDGGRAWQQRAFNGMPGQITNGTSHLLFSGWRGNMVIVNWACGQLWRVELFNGRANNRFSQTNWGDEQYPK